MPKRPTTKEREHMERVAQLPCLVCGARATVHHVTAGIHGGRVSRRHDRVTPLCPVHHQVIYGPRESVEALGHAGFFYTYGIDLMVEAERLWAESDERRAA